MLNYKSIADGVFTCNKCGAKRKLKINVDPYTDSNIDYILSHKMIHVCNKSENKFGIMSLTDITLGYDCDMDRILDNTYLSVIPVRHSTSIKLEELSEQIGKSDNEV